MKLNYFIESTYVCNHFWGVARGSFISWVGKFKGTTGDLRESIRANHRIETPIFIARQADSPESLEFPIRTNHATKVAKFKGDNSLGMEAVKWVVAKLQGDKTASFCWKMSGREVTR